MPTGPQGQKRPSNFIGWTALVARWPIGETTEATKTPSIKFKNGIADVNALSQSLSAVERAKITLNTATARWK